MSVLKESGALLLGVEMNGRTHRDFTIRPRLVRDSVTVMESGMAQSNDAYRGVALIACQIESLGDLVREQITTELLLSMFDADLAVIMEANTRLEVRIQSFRKQNKGSADIASSSGENRHAVA